MDRVNVLGVGVTALNMERAVEAINRWIADDDRQYVCVTGVHGVMESQRDEDLRQIHNAAGMVTPDGMPLVWLSKLNGHDFAGRVYGPDLMLAVCEESIAKGHKHFFYGGAEGVPELLAKKLQARFPGLQVVGTYSPPFRPLTEEEDNMVIKMIDDSEADIVWIGLSTPKQERWMAAHIGRIQAPVMLGVGAAFDFHSGRKKQAPGWMQRNGLEWLFRLVTEPRRLAKRYLINNPLFIWKVAGQYLRPNRYSLE